ncbi:MAG: hypothetical protein HY927_06625 [Elusimicrobia bacterium]|nr:hypothetical protein [Elusimicrobiota bacterium]
MRYVCALLGYLTGKWGVKCDECRHLDGEGKCHGHQMPAEVIHRPIACGFWSRK